ncbi:hypothetical protein AAHA92_23964 [Salvia divinorum]|uniref:Uncharacterized protein n=1 Tax=Salvia divinorum TaxID=28513 RepID=A0ABD1G8Y0_SALDI
MEGGTTNGEKTHKIAVRPSFLSSTPKAHDSVASPFSGSFDGLLSFRSENFVNKYWPSSSDFATIDSDLTCFRGLGI